MSRRTDGLNAGCTCYEVLCGLGGRDISVFTTDGRLVSTMGGQLERITASAVPATSTRTTRPRPSTIAATRAPEPEGLTFGKGGGGTYAFVGNEVSGGTTLLDVARVGKTQR